ncbi:MAG: hypothetical protein WA840_04395 [Caulobacteraceae bacterium]
MSESASTIWLSRLTALVGVAAIFVQGWYATHPLNLYIFGAGFLLFLLWIPMVGWVIVRRGAKGLWHFWIGLPLMLETTLLIYLNIAILFFHGG